MRQGPRRRVSSMHRRDWAGSVVIAALIALAGLLHSHTLAAAVLGAVAFAGVVVVLFDVFGGATAPPIESSAPDARPRARLAFDRPYVRPYVSYREGSQINHASFAIVAVRNDGTEDAHNVIAWLTALDVNGEQIPNTKTVKAHWADQHVAGQRSITLPANGDPHALDLAMRIIHENATWLYDDESVHELRRVEVLIRHAEFWVRVDVKASNADSVSTVVRVRVAASSRRVPLLEVVEDESA